MSLCHPSIPTSGIGAWFERFSKSVLWSFTIEVKGIFSPRTCKVSFEVHLF